MSNWKTTSDLFEKLIDKPKMSEKLLMRPPFKYLFDIISETAKKTNFGNGLFEGEELKPDYYGEKKRKIDYFVKIISLVQAMTGEKVAANPQKIVAGMEPEQTNELLQIIHQCATSKKSSDPYVKKVLGGGSAEEQQPEAKPEKKKIERPPSAAKTKKTDQKESQPVSKKNMEKEREPERVQPKEEEEPEIKEKPKKKQEYSKKVQELMDEGEEEVKKESQAQKRSESKEEDNENKISLGRVGKKKRGANEGGEKIISNTGELNEKELDLVKSMIQSICHNTAPLGKSIEFINDDVESMNREQQFWRKQYHASKAKYQNELKISEEALLPIYDKLGEIDNQIKDQKGKIQTVKAQIIKNESTINDLLMSVIATK